MKYQLLIFSILLLVGACSKDPEPVPIPVPVKEYSTGLIKPPKRMYGVLHFSPKNFQGEIPEEFSWEDKGFETPVRDQGQCGSCWAFGGTQSLEMAYKIFGQKGIDFSEQELVGKLFYGCGGGYFVHDYQIKNGQTDEASCPYRANNSKCASTVKPAGKAVQGGLVGKLGKTPTEEEMKIAIMTYGAIAVTVTANSQFMNPSGDFITACPHGQTNHIVALTGWKVGPGGYTYFKVKNSWSQGWGNKGYAYVRLGCFDLGEEASWVAIDAVPCKPPAVKMPAEYVLTHGDDVLLAVKSLTGVTYAWYVNGKKVGDGPQLEYHADESTVVVLKVKNQCGEGEIQSIITVKE